MTLKNNVRLGDLKPQLLIAIMIANDVYKAHSQELVITSVDDSTHGKNSLHPSGNAFDLRTSYFTKQECLQVTQELKEKMPTGDFDIVFENDHIHIEYDPK